MKDVVVVVVVVVAVAVAALVVLVLVLVLELPLGRGGRRVGVAGALSRGGRVAAGGVRLVAAARRLDPAHLAVRVVRVRVRVGVGVGVKGGIRF